MPKCYMFVSHRSLNSPHLATGLIHQGEEKKQCRLVDSEKRAGTATAITAYGIPFAPVSSLKYLGRFLLVPDNDWPVVVHDLSRVWQKWAWLTRVLVKEVADYRTS